jgi:hypothetical protein
MRADWKPMWLRTSCADTKNPLRAPEPEEKTLKRGIERLEIGKNQEKMGKKHKRIIQESLKLTLTTSFLGFYNGL